MADDPLIRELRQLSAHLSVPPAPDVRTAVRARLAARPRRRWRAVAAALAVAVLIAVVPPARAAVAHAVSDLLDFAGVRVKQGQPAPAPTPSPLPSARPVGLDEARGLARFPVGVPARLGPPERVEVADGARVVTLLYHGGAVRLDEFDGRLNWVFLKTEAERDGQFVDDGIWFPRPHAVEYVDRTGAVRHETSRLAGPTLIWTNGPVTYRLEGVTALDEALAIARSMN
jgi:hypothetical protein